MSQPKNARKRYGRVYVWPPEEPYELEVPSTTTIIGDGIPKRFLMYWAANQAAEYAVEHVDAWTNLPDDDAYDLIRKAHSRYTNRRGDRGTAAHAAVEAYLEGREPDFDADPDTEALYQGALSFLEDHDVQVDEVEATVYSREHQYAGTADLFGTFHGKPAVMDWKTSKRIYPEVALQLSSYAHGEFIGRDDGTEDPVPDVELGVGIRLFVKDDEDGEPQGGYEAVPLDVGETPFRVFLAAQSTYEWTRTLKRQVQMDLDLVTRAA